MAGRKSGRKIRVPLDDHLYRRLRAESERTGRPATRIAREAIQRFLDKMRRSAVREAIASCAASCAGTAADLDPDLEAAGAEQLRDSVEPVPQAPERRASSRVREI